MPIVSVLERLLYTTFAMASACAADRPTPVASCTNSSLPRGSGEKLEEAQTELLGVEVVL